MSHVTAGKKTETPLSKNDFWNTSELDNKILSRLIIDEESSTGLRWCSDVGCKIKSGDEAFTAIGRNGYRVGRIDGKNLYAHRVIWFLSNGVWPEKQIDHIDGDRLNNSIRNLRSVDQLTNSKNIKMLASNTSGFTGVYFCKRDNRFSAYYNLMNKKINVSCDGTLFDAVASLISARRSQGVFTERHGR